MRKIYFVKLFLTCFILVLCLAAIAQPAVLKVHYLLDETEGTVAADASGNGFNGTVSATASWAEGTLGGALEFKGTENVTLPAGTIGLTSANGSVAFWMNADVPTAIYTMFWGGDNTTGGGFGPENELHVHLETAGDYWAGGELSFWVLANPNVHIFSDPAKGTVAGVAPVNPTLLGDKQWHHVAATWGGGMVKLFIDGVKIMEAGYVSTSYPLSNMFLGQMAGGGRTYTGLLDDVRIYSGVLGDFDVNKLFLKITGVEDTKVKDLTELAAYPNPAVDNLTVRFFSYTPDKAKVSLVSLTGQVLETIELDAIADYNFVHFDANKYSQGIYFVDLEVEGNTSHTKVVIE